MKCLKTISSLFFVMGLLIASVKGQSSAKLIFLGDTIRLDIKEENHVKRNKNAVLTAIENKQSYYKAIGVGKIDFENYTLQIADPLDDGVTKVLVIGNSFSDDGVEYYLHDLAKENGKPLVIGNLFRGGAPLDFHLKNAIENNAIYDYRKTTIDGAKSNQRKTSILTALNDENWDIICFQQSSILSGDIESVQRDLPKLFEYVKENYPIPTVKYAFHQTWAYAQNATTKNFEKYNNDQELMYTKIVEVSKQVAAIIPVDFIVPTGTAIQNGRGSSIGDNFTREGYHLDLRIGRFTAASTWYEAIFGDLSQNKFKPFNLSNSQALLAKEAALQAVKTPFGVSPIEATWSENEENNFDTIRINFGADLVMPGWNSFLFERNNTMLSGLVDNNNSKTKAYLKLVDDFTLRSANGPKRTATSLKMPREVSQSYFLVELQGEEKGRPFIEIGNLDAEKKYDLSFFSATEDDQNPFELYAISEGKTINKRVWAGNNKTQMAELTYLKPNKAGKLYIYFKTTELGKKTNAIINAVYFTESKK